MPAKRGSKQFHLSSEVNELIEKAIAEEGWTYGKTKWCERVLRDHATKKCVSASEVATEKLFVTMFGLGLIDEKRLNDVLALLKAGGLPASVPSDKFGIRIEGVRDPKSRK